MNTLVKTVAKTFGWICRVLGIWTFFAFLLAVCTTAQAPWTLIIPFVLYVLGSWLVEGNELFKFKWK